MQIRPLSLTLALLALPAVAAAGPVHDFATLAAGDKVTSLGTGISTIGPVSAQGFSTRSGAWAPDRLIARDENNDHGLGVCSESQAASGGPCNIGGTGGGDNNELSATGFFEAILFSLADDYLWTELWVSSLDAGDADGVEEGRVHWGNSSDILTLLGGPSFAFEWGDFGASVEGDILSLGAAAGFNAAAKYVLFIPDGGLTDNNDYLVWGASTRPIPEPGTLMLFGGGLAALRAARRRRQS